MITVKQKKVFESNRVIVRWLNQFRGTILPQSQKGKFKNRFVKCFFQYGLNNIEIFHLELFPNI